MSKYDIYLLENSRVLKNKLGIENEAASEEKTSKYKKYYTDDYHPTPH